VATINDDHSEAQQQLDWAKGQPDEYVALDWQANSLSFNGQWRQAQEVERSAAEQAARRDVKGVAARYLAEQALRAAILGHCEMVPALTNQSLSFQHNAVSLPHAALALAVCGQTSQTQAIVDELTKQHDRNTLVQGLWLPAIRAAVEFQRGNAAGALDQLQTVARYETAGEFWPPYLRGGALLRLNRAAEAAAEFQKIIDHRGQAPFSVLYPLAHLGVARAAALSGDKSKSRSAFEKFFDLWKNADPELPLLQQARNEFGKKE
jgi:hypothetical protein